jgi:predicted ester cyclase
MGIDAQKGTPVTDQAVLQANKELIRSYTRDVFNAHKPERAAEFLAPEAKWNGGTLGTVKGRDNIVGLLQGFIGALPDIDAVEQEMVAEGNSVWVRYVINATHQGDLLGIPATGRKVQWTAVDVYHLSEGKITEEWAEDDLLAILHDIGFVTPPWLG